jgi:hypothetical protein
MPDCRGVEERGTFGSSLTEYYLDVDAIHSQRIGTQARKIRIPQMPSSNENWDGYLRDRHIQTCPIVYD